MRLWDVDSPTYKQSTGYRLSYSLCIFILLFLGYKWQHNLSSVMDILAADEAEYLRNGLALFDKIYKDWGPSYNIWYKLLSVFTTDKLELYYLNYILTAIVSAILLFIVLERYSIQLAIALFISGMFFMSEINIETWPRISHFVFILLMIGLYISSFIRYTTQKLFLFSTIAIIAAYARPEIRPFAFLLLALSCFMWFKEKLPFKNVAFYFLAAIFFFAFFQIVYGSPAEFYRGNVNRMYIAFCQHYAGNMFLHGDKSIDAYAGWRIYADKTFPGCDTFTCILKEYPFAVLKNIWYNISNYAFMLFKTEGSFVFPISIIHKQKTFIAVCVMVLLFLLFSFIYKPIRKQIFDQFLKYKWQFLSVFIIGLPSMAISVLIFPRMHYILCHVFLFIFLLATCFSIVWKQLRIPTITLFVIAAILIFISPKANDYIYFRGNADLANLCGQKYVHYFSKDKVKPHVVFSDILNLSYMLSPNYSDYSVEYDFKKNMKFDSILKVKNIDIVFVNQNILENPYLKNDSTWHFFINNYQTLGFEKKIIKNECNVFILQKK